MDDSLIDGYINSDEINKNRNLMPQNLEAEQSLIGSILFDNKVLEELSLNFNSTYFFDPLHSSIYEAIVSLIEKGRLADPLTLKNYLNVNIYIMLIVIKIIF